MNELDIIRIIQSIHNEFLDGMFQFITSLGESTIILIFILSLYWSVNKKMGEYIAYSFFTSGLLNNSLKNFFKAPRPIGEEGIRSIRVHTATGYSFPSGHSQGAASTYSAFAIFNKKKIINLGVVILISFIGISRLYLGVHYPKDVIVGLILGTLTAAITYFLFNKIENHQLLYLMTLMIFIPGLFNPSMDLTKSMGSFIGFCFGTLVEVKKIKFSTDIKLIQKIIRTFFGAMVLLILKTILPNDENLSIFLSNTVLTFIGFGIVPFSFKYIK